MANERLRVIVDEILVQIKQTFDDRDVSRAQVAYWAIIVGNSLLGNHIQKRDSGAFLSIFDQVPVLTVSPSSSPNFVQGRKFIQLPSAVFDFNNDDGIEYITYQSSGLKGEKPKFSYVKMHRTNPSQAEWLEMNPHTKATPTQPYWYRVGNLIYLLGMEGVPMSTVEMGIYMTINPLEKIDFDAPFPIPQELMKTLKMQVLDIARSSFFFYPQSQNSGDDSTVEEAHAQIQKISSVNQQQPQPEA